MIKIDSIREDDLSIIKELFFENNTVYITKDAKFVIDGDVIKCTSSKFVNPASKEDLLGLQLRILRIKEIAEGIGYKFIDLRREVNN